MFRCYLGANICAPIHEPLSVLDVGTGSGRWAIEVAMEYPTAEVLGLDISITAPNFPTPKNCRFVVGDLTKGLSEFADASYYLVHSR
jgi:ubiquinone/menaquinone biosynthesis C-methylase UbiE